MPRCDSKFYETPVYIPCIFGKYDGKIKIQLFKLNHRIIMESGMITRLLSKLLLVLLLKKKILEI